MAAESRSSFYKPELDIVRFLAFFSVFIHHIFPNTKDLYLKHFPEFTAVILANIANCLGYGLSVFFFLSAYLIATLLMIEHEKYGHIDLKQFYIRRILRIWPLYYVGVGVGILFAYWRYPDQIHIYQYYLFFASNLYFHSHPFPGILMGHLWSISTEEQFYIAFPLLILLFRRFFYLPIGIFFILLSLAALTLEGSYGGNDDVVIWTNTFCQFIFFGTGIVCAVFTRNHEIKLSPFLRASAFTLSWVLFFCASYFFLLEPPISIPTTVPGYVLVAVGCVLLLFSVLNAPFKFPAFLVYLGKISYGLYVWHRLGIFMVGHFVSHNVVVELLAIVPTVVISALSYRYFESPFLRLKEKFTHIKSRPA